ncbi:stabilizer of axonemal microtubules 2-like isoform X1 [Mytilus trossulus]|uniref:stabilizer of axonemal microtubules 2-like isoform X1 n=2 Tax=Mytilus trossulus TaxID=6551 RepID=UPI0030043705
MTSKCNECICGKHTRPHVHTDVIGRGDPSQKSTEYNQTYKQHPLTMRESFKPNAEAMQGGSFEDRTTNRQDYIKHPMEKPFVRVPDQYQRPDGAMDGMTSYNKDFTKKMAPPAQQIRHDGQKMQGGKFEGEPTYKSDYKKWDMSGRPGPYVSKDAWVQPTARFEGQTTMNHDYRKYAQQPRQSMKPQEASKLSDAPFADNTDYRQSYQPHALGPKFVREREQYKAPGVPFDGVTTFKRDYRGPVGELTKSFKPDNQAFSSGQPLEDLTTNRKDYIKYPTSKPYVHVQDGYKKPEGDMFMQTTHNSTYRELPLARNALMRPTDAGKVSNAPFDGTTNYAQNYKQWQVRRVEQPAREGYHPNNAPFEGMSTQKAHYIPHGMVPNRSFKPDNTALQSDAPFEDSTMYRQDYVPKPRPLCPCYDSSAPNVTCARHNVIQTVTKLPQGMAVRVA